MGFHLHCNFEVAFENFVQSSPLERGTSQTSYSVGGACVDTNEKAGLDIRVLKTVL